MNKVFAILFTISCIATSTVSSHIMGIGIWFWVIIVIGMVVGISQFFKPLIEMGTALAILLSVISACAILLGLVAATIGGSFRMDDSAALLLFLFFTIIMNGIALALVNNKKNKKADV